MNKVTKEAIEAKIKSIEFKKLSDKLTHCIITMENGFQVTGESACVDPKNYDREIGERIAKEQAFEKLWPLEGYLLQEKLHLKKRFEERNPNCVIHPEEALPTQIIAEKMDSAISEKFVKSWKKEQRDKLYQAIFQHPLVPEECHKVFSQGTSYEQKVEHKTCNCMDWEKYPQVKKMLFYQMFPNANQHTFDDLEKDLKRITHLHTDNWEYDIDLNTTIEKNGVISSFPIKGIKVSYNRACKMVSLDIGDCRVKRAVFERLFPHAPSFAFDFCDGKIMFEGKMPEVIPMKGMAVVSEADREKMLKSLYPRMSKQTFKELEASNLFGSDLDIEKQDTDYHIRLTKQYRKDLDAALQSIKSSRRQSRERSLAITKIQEGIMWLGMDLKELGAKNPYPTSYDPTTVKVEPTADGLKL